MHGSWNKIIIFLIVNTFTRRGRSDEEGQATEARALLIMLSERMCKSMTKLITSLDEDPSGQLGLSVGCVWRGGAGRGGARYRCYEL